MVLFSDATILTETPPLRACWSPVGEPTEVPVSGNRHNRTLYGTMNIATGHRIIESALRWNGQTWRDHLRSIRQRWRGWRIILFVDRGTPHTAKASREMASERGIELRWLPTACPELNPIESLWRWLKGAILCNHQADRFDQTVEQAAEALRALENKNALSTAGILSKNFWLTT